MMNIKLPGQLGHLDFSRWLYGLLSAFIGGGSGAFAAGVSSMAVDPDHFNAWSPLFWKMVGSTFVIAGLIPFFAYLHTQPLPPYKQVTNLKETTVATTGKPTVKTTVEETHTEITEVPKKEG